LLCGYTKPNDFSINQANGLILLWSLAMRKAPEFTLTCQTEITSAVFHKFNPKLVIGASFTGQILIWDTRGKSVPVLKTPPANKVHTHPIYCLGINGTTNSNNIVSVSNDGLLCTWSVSNLSKYTKRIELKKKKVKSDTPISSSTQNQSTDEIGAICMAIPENDLNTVLIGSDDADIYQVSTHQKNEMGDSNCETFSNHTGPIHSIDIHPGDYHKHGNVYIIKIVQPSIPLRLCRLDYQSLVKEF
jgi:dynein intermediate chain